MKTKTLGGISALLFAAAGIFGVPPGRTETTGQESVYAELTKVPEKFRNKPNPLAGDAEAAAAGAGAGAAAAGVLAALSLATS